MWKKFLNSHPLFKECVEILNARILPLEEDKNFSDLFKQLFPITEWGKIDWEKIDRKIEVGYDPLDIIPTLKKLLGKNFDKSVYILWSDGGMPLIQTNIDAIVNNFDDVTCVAFEKFIFNSDIAYIIEVLPGNKITVGVIPQIHA